MTPTNDRALVVFGDDNAHPLSFLLKPLFRHVSVAILDHRTGLWMHSNFTLNGLEWCVEASGDFPLEEFYLGEGLTVVSAPYRPSEKHQYPLMLNNCVGHVKLILGVNSLAFTPYQLYRDLKRRDLGAPS